MNLDDLPIPGFLAAPELSQIPANIEDLTLDLYQRTSDTSRNAADTVKRIEQQVRERGRATDRVIAVLAAERFEFERVLRRIRPELEQLNAPSAERVLGLFARSWDATLARLKVECRDLTGLPLTDELAAEVEVESAIPGDTDQTVIRETLFPLVIYEGRVAALAKVVTLVAPVPAEEEQ
jgi:hypothetical protein